MDGCITGQGATQSHLRQRLRLRFPRAPTRVHVQFGKLSVGSVSILGTGHRLESPGAARITLSCIALFCCRVSLRVAIFSIVDADSSFLATRSNGPRVVALTAQSFQSFACAVQALFASSLQPCKLGMQRTQGLPQAGVQVALAQWSCSMRESTARVRLRRVRFSPTQRKWKQELGWKTAYCRGVLFERCKWMGTWAAWSKPCTCA